jgi:hypothetical protein
LKKEAVNSFEAKDDHKKHKCLVRVFSKVSGQVGSFVQKYESKSIIVRFASVVVFEGTHRSLLTPPKALYTEAREF